jgi:hypothetical protein
MRVFDEIQPPISQEAWQRHYDRLKCEHAKQVGRTQLGIDIYRSETRCADCGKLLKWKRYWLVF